MEIGTIDLLLKAQKAHLNYLRDTRQMVSEGRRMHSRVFNAWPNGHVCAAHKRRNGNRFPMSSVMSAKRRCFQVSRQTPTIDLTSTSLPISSKKETSPPMSTPSLKPLPEKLETKTLRPANEEYVSDNILPGGRKMMQTVDLTMEWDDSLPNNTLDGTKNDQSDFDQSALDQSGLDQSILERSGVDDLPSEASFSKHLEERPDTACSTPAKMEASQNMLDDSIAQIGKTPKRQLVALADQPQGKIPNPAAIGINFYVSDEPTGPLQPLTITQLAKTPETSAMSAMAVAQVKESLDMSNAVSPTKISARIEAEELPKSLETSLSRIHVTKLKQLKYEQAKSLRTQKALRLIEQMQKKLEDLAEDPTQLEELVLEEEAA